MQFICCSPSRKEKRNRRINEKYYTPFLATSSLFWYGKNGLELSTILNGHSPSHRTALSARWWPPCLSGSSYLASLCWHLSSRFLSQYFVLETVYSFIRPGRTQDIKGENTYNNKIYLQHLRDQMQSYQQDLAPWNHLFPENCIFFFTVNLEYLKTCQQFKCLMAYYNSLKTEYLFLSILMALMRIH